MTIFKLAIWFDKDWRIFLGKSWKRRHYWVKRDVRWTVGRYVLGPFRMEVSLPSLPREPDRVDWLVRLILGNKHGE